MRVLLVGPDYEENLSIRYLSSSLLAAGHETALAPFNSIADAPSVAESSEHADLIGLSMCFQSRAQEFLHLAQLIKSREPKKVIIAGGHYASCAAEPLLANHLELDIIVIHEGERTLVEIADAARHLKRHLPEISGIAYRHGDEVRFTPQRRTLDNLDALPFPARRGPVHSVAGVPTSYMMGSRGCYGNCAYCCITTLHRIAPGKRFRQRGAELIAEEMSNLYHERGTRQFVFHDDNFLVPAEAINHARISTLESSLLKRGVKDIALVIKCRPADANYDILRRLKDLGLVRVFLGVESATEQGLSSLERAQTVDDSIRALETCASLDISAQFTLMTFNPDATLDALRSDITFMRRFSSNPQNFCRAEIYAGTPLEQRMMDLGRARGDYLAREYHLTDPAADLACALSLDVFHTRCWAGGSLMQIAIGIDHMGAVVKRFGASTASKILTGKVSDWLRSVNLDTINLLEEVIELSSSGAIDAASQRSLTNLRDRESSTRVKFLSEGAQLKAELEALRFDWQPKPSEVVPVPRLRFARKAAVAVLALGMPAAAACRYGVSEMAPPPLKDAKAPTLPLGNSKDGASISGTITDSSGAVVQNVTITITYVETGQSRTLKTNNVGQYSATDLPAGHYTVKAEAPSFKVTVVPGIELKAGASQKIDIRFEIANYGCCEYAAAPLRVVPEDYSLKHKPFAYTVGEAKDEGTLKGIAQLVYGDRRMWIQIFEANRNILDKPGAIANGISLTIPPRKREVPKLISHVAPVYPPAALQQHLTGEVVIDVTLKEDGSVNQVGVIDGDSILAESAVTAVKQWRYLPLSVNGKPVLKFVVVTSFSKDGKVH